MLYIAVNKSSLARLHLGQNAAARCEAEPLLKDRVNLFLKHFKAFAPPYNSDQ